MVVKRIKSETSVDLRCDCGNYFSGCGTTINTMVTGILSRVKAVEQVLKIESSENLNDNLTNAELQTAAEMFLYLNMCPDTTSTSNPFLCAADFFLQLGRCKEAVR